MQYTPRMLFVDQCAKVMLINKQVFWVQEKLLLPRVHFNQLFFPLVVLYQVIMVTMMSLPLKFLR